MVFFFLEKVFFNYNSSLEIKKDDILFFFFIELINEFQLFSIFLYLNSAFSYSHFYGAVAE